MFDERVYDGILVSRMALESAARKRQRAEQIGMRAYLCMPDDLELFGDCGASGWTAHSPAAECTPTDRGDTGRRRCRQEWGLANEPRAVASLSRRLLLGARGAVVACYEARPTGFALMREFRAKGVDCRVIAPALIPRKPVTGSLRTSFLKRSLPWCGAEGTWHSRLVSSQGTRTIA